LETLKKPNIFFATFIATSGFWYIFGGPIWIFGLAVALPWVIFFSVRFNKLISSILAGSVILILEIWVGIFSSILSVPLFMSIGATLALIGFIGILFVNRRAKEISPVSVPFLWNILSVSFGAIIWYCGIIAAQFIPRSSKVGWVMSGDSANNILMARDVLTAGGIEVGAQSNPAPLPSALIAYAIAPSRENQFLENSLFSDVSNLSGLWAALIALTCVVSGSLVFVSARNYSDNVFKVRGLALLGSLLPLTWFYSGYPLDFGFFNSQIAMPILFLSLLTFYASLDHKRVNLVIQPLLGTLLLAIWAPLVVIPVSLYVATLLTTFRREWKVRVAEYWLVAFSAFQFVLYAIVVVLPMLLSMSSAVSASGGVYDFNHSMLWVLAGLTVILARFSSNSWINPLFVGPTAVAAGIVFAQFYLLYLNKSLEDPWTYYPLKFLWMASAVLLLLISVQISILLIRYLNNLKLFITAVFISIFAMVVFLNWSPMKVSGYVWKDPLQRILAGNFMGRGDSTAQIIFDSSETKDTEIYWNSGVENEEAINFWLLQNSANSIKPQVQKLREFAYGMYDRESPKSLCLIANEIPGNLKVHSPDKQLQFQLDELCPELEISVTAEFEN
jgi:hypothetical protein